jgi:hypothetical protein
MEMESERDFRLGFWFALFVARTLSYKSEPSELYDRLREIARGEVTLIPSPEEVMSRIPEALRDFESKIGRPPTEEERQMIEQIAKGSIVENRGEQDAMNRQFAKLILRLMNQPI